MPDSTYDRKPLQAGGSSVPPLALGSWNTWDRMTRDDAVALIARAVELDAGFFDVAFYNMGPHAENSRTDILFGEALRESGVRRDEIVLCGKLWLWDWPNQASVRRSSSRSTARASTASTRSWSATTSRRPTCRSWSWM